MTKNKILITLTDTDLIIANTGKPFTEESVVSLCDLHISAKDKQNKINLPEKKEENLITDIQQSNLEDWTNTSKNHFEKHINSFNAKSKDYEGREIVELLQNAIDPITDNAIGKKGVGFKAVFNICNTPEIYSNSFYFHFDGNKTAELLKEHEIFEQFEKKYPIKKDPRHDKVLSMLLPHILEPEQNIKKLLQQYSTIIRLPLDSIPENLIIEVQELYENPYFLLFLQHHSDIAFTVDMMGDENTFCMKTYKDEFYMYESQNSKIKIAIPKKDSIKYKHKKIWHYFATEQEVKINALLHMDLDVSDNRKDIREKSSDAWDTEIQNILEKILNDTEVPITTRITCFEHYKYNTQTEYNSFKEFVNQKIAQYYQEIDFIPTYGNGMSNIMECVYWDYDNPLLKIMTTDTHEDIKQHNLVCPKTQIKQDILKKSISDYKKIPFWQMKGGIVTSISCDIPVRRDLQLPAFFTLGVDYNILQLPDNIEEYKENCIYEILPDNNCTKIIQHKIENTFDWENQGNEILDFIHEQYKQKNIDLKQLRDHIKVPVKNHNTWHLAKHVYAGTKNGGLDIDTIINTLTDRFILDYDTTSKKEFFENIGVSYGFKVYDVENLEEVPADTPLLQEYQVFLKQEANKKFKYNMEYKKLKQQTKQYIDNFEKIIHHIRDKYDCNTLCEKIQRINRRFDFLGYQLKHTAWVKVKGNPILQSDTRFMCVKDMYISDKIKSSFFAVPDLEPIRHSDSISFLKNLDIQTSLTKKIEEWEQYFDKFKTYIKTQSEDNKKRLCKGFYKTCYDALHDTNAPNLKILCETDNGLKLKKSSEVYYYDTPLLQKDSIKENLKKTYPIAIVAHTSEEKHICDFFKIEKLSTKIHAPQYGGEIVNPNIILKIEKAHKPLQKYITEKTQKTAECIKYPIKIVENITFKIDKHDIPDEHHLDRENETIYIANSKINQDIIERFARAIDNDARNDILRIIELCHQKNPQKLQDEFRQWGMDLNEEDIQGFNDSDSKISDMENTLQNESKEEHEAKQLQISNPQTIPTEINQQPKTTREIPTAKTTFTHQRTETETNPNIFLPPEENNECVDHKTQTSSNIGTHESNSNSKLHKDIEQQAIKNCTDHYENMGYEVISVEADNMGWDLEVTKDQKTLYVEVKGRGNKQYIAQLSENEYEKMQQHKNKYIIFISNLDGYKVFEYDTVQNRWIDNAGNTELEIQEKTTKPKAIVEAKNLKTNDTETSLS